MKFYSLLILLSVCLRVFADSPIIKTSAIDARSSSLANTFTAIADNYSAAYWNPAALAYMPVRGVETSMGYLHNSQESLFGQEKSGSFASRITFNNLGWIRSIPASRGGLTFAIGILTPYTFDNNYSFRGLDKYIGNNPMVGPYYLDIVQKDSITFDTIADTLHSGEYLWFEKAGNRSYGSLRLVGTSAALQIAEGVSVGATLSYITGRENQQIIFETYRNDDNSLFEDSKEFIERSYSGLDFRISMMLKAKKYFSAGLLVNLPQYMKFYQIYQYTDQYYGINLTPLYDEGRVKTSTKLSASIALDFPIATLAIQANGNSPIPSAEEEDPRSFWQNSFSLALSVPLGKLPLKINGGYSFGDDVLYPVILLWNNGNTSTEPTRLENNGIKTFAGGIEWQIKDIINVSASYLGSLRNYKLKSTNWENVTEERHFYNQITLSFGFRY